MWSILLIACIIFQSSVAIFLLNRVRRNNNFDKHLRALLLILAAHLSTKFLLLAVLKDTFLYAEVPTGFSFAYGPLLLLIARSALGRAPVASRIIFYHFTPFLVFSTLYFTLVIAGATGRIPHSSITGYAAWYQWLAVISMYSYPLYIKSLLRRRGEDPRLEREDLRLEREDLRVEGEDTRPEREDARRGGEPLPGSKPERELASQIASVLLLSISTAFLLFTFIHTVWEIHGFDLRLLPYMCFAAIPVLILRYRLQAQATAETPAAKAESRTAIFQTRVIPEPGESIPQTRETAHGPAEAILQHVGAFLQPGTATTVASEEKPSPDRRYEKSGIHQPLMDEYETALAAFMEKSRIYLDADLSLEQLASRMKMPKHHLTQLLNERLTKSFYNYINEYRINEAISRLNDLSAQVNILSLAFDCGFNSRSSFNNYFKKIKGCTPSAYRKQITTAIQDISLATAAASAHLSPAARKGKGRQTRTLPE